MQTDNASNLNSRLPLAMKPLGLLLALSVLSACGGSATEITRDNPNFFAGDVDRKTKVMTGAYDPSSFSSTQVRKLVTAVCASGRLSGFSEAERDGLVEFSAMCSGGFASSVGFVEFERVSSSIVLIETTGGDGRGNVVFGEKQVSI